MSTKTLHLLLAGLFLLLSFTLGRGQCNNNNFTMSADTICGNEEVTFQIANPNPNLTYFWNYGQGGGVDETGAVVSHIYPPRTTNRNFTVTVFNGQGACSKTITVLSTPDAALEPITGALVDGNTIAYCGSTSDFPEFNLTVQNTSTTTSANTNYTIDWGDGSPIWTSANFNTASHTYTSQGQFTLSLTVEGSTNCPSSTVEFMVFNSSDPGGSIVNTTNTVTTCYPNTIGYPILGTGNNIPGTTYEISISGVVMAYYNHPPPDTFYHTFNETSCDQGTFPFDDDEFVIRMTVMSPCQDKLSFVTARLGTPPLAGFDMFPSVICPGETLSMINTSAGSQSTQQLCVPIRNANWMIVPRTYNIIMGDTLNSEFLEIEPLEAVDYTITMWVENMCGSDTMVQVATVGVDPVADANAILDQPNVCAPVEASFTNLSTVDPSVTYHWQVSPSAGAAFTGGTNASSFEPEILFSQTGIYTVTLTAENDCGEPAWDTVFDIRSRPGIDFPAISNICAESYVFSNNVNITGDPDMVNWTFTGGNPSSYTGLTPPPVTFTGTGSYSISVTATNTCGDSTVIEDFQLSDPIIIDAGPDLTACFNEGPRTLSGLPVGGVWTGEGITGTNVFDPGATISDVITLTYTFDNGICTISDTRSVEVIRIDGLTAGPDASACVNDAPFYLSGNSPAGGSWFGPGVTDASSGAFNPSAAGLGTHTIGYIYTESVLSCRDTAYRIINVMDIPPIVLGTQSTACVGAFITLSTAEVSGATAVWDFGDGNSEEGFTVGHIYEYRDTFLVVVTVSAGMGCSNVDSTEIITIDAPVAAFTVDDAEGCNGLMVNFSNESIGIIDQYFWDFGIDSLTSDEQDPAPVTYPAGMLNDTIYSVILIATGFCGPDSAVQEIFIRKPPVAFFGTNVNSICPGEELHFNNLTYNSPESYIWNFGNGVVSTNANPSPQIYPTPPADTVITITMIAFNECGSDTASRDILVKTVDVVSFFNTDPLSGCEPLEVNFQNFSSLGALVVWDFGDGNTSTLNQVAHTFEEDGIYTVSLAVDNGCSRDTSYVNINVLQSPEISFEYPDKACEGDAVLFTNTTANGFGYNWTFGDSDISNNVSPTHVYSDAGTYTVTLVGENQYGCSSSLSSTIEIITSPDADFNAGDNELCAGGEVSFYNESDGGENYFWEFGNGSVSYEEEPTINFSEPGSYDVTLVVNSDNFCYDTVTYQAVVEVFPSPLADFDFKQTVEGIEYGRVEFSNLSEGALTYTWYFGDGSVSTEISPVHQYSQSGQYPVSLVAVNQYDCADSIIKFVEVEFFGKLFVPNAFSPVLGGQSGASVFLPKGVSLHDYELEIYSSYGELLWRNTELIDGRPAVGWDGTYQGRALPQDVYIWKIRAFFDNGLSWQGAEVDGVLTTVGTLTLVR